MQSKQIQVGQIDDKDANISAFIVSFCFHLFRLSISSFCFASVCFVIDLFIFIMLVSVCVIQFKFFFSFVSFSFNFVLFLILVPIYCF